MMRTTILTVLALASLAPAAAVADATDDFRALLEEHWEWVLAENPVFASRLGDRRYNDQWQDMSLDAIESRFDKERDFLRRLLAIDPGSLDETERLNYDLFRRSLQDDIEGQRFRTHLMPMSQRGGVQSLESTAEGLRLTTVRDYEDWLARMANIETVVEQTMELLDEGRRTGYMPPKVLMERIPAQISAQLVEEPNESPYYKAFADLPAGFEVADRERLEALAAELIEDSIVPAYRRFERYFVNTYLPASRDTIGASALPDGAAFYEYRARLYTTTQMTPDEIHRLGLEEVARIRREMQLVIDELEFDGSFSDFLEFLRTDPQFYYDSPEALFEGYLAVSKRIDPLLVGLYGQLPRMQ